MEKITKVLMGGHFDVLHTGHIFAMRVAKSFGDYLIVNVSPDNRVREMKGEGRPFLSVKERCYIVDSLEIVDEVKSIKAKSGMSYVKYQLYYIGKIKPDVFYDKEYRKEIDGFCQKNKIRYAVVPSIVGIDKMHATDIIEKIKSMKSKS